jgi:hypothetical protein
MNERRMMSGAAAILAALVVVSVVLGPLMTGSIVFRMSENAIDQYRGSEVISLVLIAPVLLGAAVLGWRAHASAPYLALAGALFCVYTYVTVIAGQEYRSYDGNVERSFPLFAGMIAIGVVIVVLAGRQIAIRPAVIPPDRARNTLAGGLLAMSGLVGIAWAGQILQVYRGTPSTGYSDSPAIFWLIKLLDYGFVIPVAVLIAAGVWQRRPHAFEAGTALACFASLLAIGIGAMIVSTTAADQGSLPIAYAAGLILAAAALLLIAARLIALATAGPRHPETKGRMAPSTGVTHKRAA